jgi:hypothetical protein
LAAALSRRIPSPLEGGQTRSWDAGIVYALGRVNFLSDDSREPKMTMSELCEKIGVSQGNASAKSREIWDRLGLIQMDPDWCLPSMVEENPLVWIVEVNGLPRGCAHDAKGGTGGSVSAWPDPLHAVERSDADEVC